MIYPTRRGGAGGMNTYRKRKVQIAPFQKHWCMAKISVNQRVNMAGLSLLSLERPAGKAGLGW